jgi:hypothetical protein
MVFGNSWFGFVEPVRFCVETVWFCVETVRFCVEPVWFCVEHVKFPKNKQQTNKGTLKSSLKLHNKTEI